MRLRAKANQRQAPRLAVTVEVDFNQREGGASPPTIATAQIARPRNYDNVALKGDAEAGPPRRRDAAGSFRSFATTFMP